MKGSCACGGIQYQLSSQFLVANHCHCSICRKVHGAAFGTFGHAKAEAFCWIQGKALLSGYRSSEGNVRNFCRICGSSMPSVFPKMNYVRIPLATLDDDPQTQPVAHLYVKTLQGIMLMYSTYPNSFPLDAVKAQAIAEFCQEIEF